MMVLVLRTVAQYLVQFCLRVQAYLAKSWLNLLLLGAIMQSPCVVHAI
jgi:hypothetical protein